MAGTWNLAIALVSVSWLVLVSVPSLVGQEDSSEDSAAISEMTETEKQISEYQQEFLKDPTGRSAADIRSEIARLITLRDSDGGLQTLQKLRDRKAPHGDGLDRAMLHVAAVYFEEQNYGRCKALLQEVVERYPKSSATSSAMLMMSELYTSLKDEKASAEWLKKCTEFELTERASNNLMDTDNTRSVALQRLAALHQSKGDYLQAFKLWRMWQPQSFCGNCLDAMLKTRAANLKECLLQLDDHEIIVKSCLEDALVFDGEYAQQRLVVFYRDADQLLDLARIAGELDQRERKIAKEHRRQIEEMRTMSEFLRGAIAAETLRQINDLNGLIRMLEENSVRQDVKEHTAEVLGRTGGKGVKLIDKALQDSRPGQRWYLLRALAANPSDDAVEVLVRAAISDAKFTPDRYVVDRLVARGEKGLKIAREVASGVEPSQTKAADEFLRRYESWVKMFGRAEWVTTATSQTIKPPARGSLPRTLDEAIKAAAK